VLIARIHDLREDNLSWRMEILNIDTALIKIKDLEYKINLEIDNEKRGKG
jgi:hypothetical protein